MSTDEQEMTINLRPLLEIPVRWWKVILVSVAIFLVIGLFYLVPLFSPSQYSAVAGVAIIQSRTRVTLDTTARTLSEEELSQMAEEERQPSNEASLRHVTLVNLVQNANIEEAVLDRLQDELTEDELTEEEREPGRLAAKVQGRVVETNNDTGDMIQIVATHTDPILATRIANAWAEEYEKLVNDLYARPPQITTVMRNDLQSAREAYDQKQQNLTDFIATNRIARMENEINEKQRILEILRHSQRTVISQVIRLDLNANARFYGAYLNAQTENRIIAFQKEQSKKRQLFLDYLNTQDNATFSLFNQEAEDRQRKFNEAYEAKARNEQLLREARALYEQAREGGDSASSGLALTFLKMKVAQSYPPDRFELTITDTDVVAPKDVISDTKALVVALESQQQDIEATIAEQQQLLLNGEGLFLDTPVTDTVLYRKTMDLYPELFAAGPLSELEESIGPATWLEQKILEIAEKMHGLSHEEYLTSYMAKNPDTPLNRLISTLEDDIPQLESRLVQEEERKSMLEQERDLAFNTYTTLSRKVAEFQLANQLPSTEVRLAAQAAVPTEPSDRQTRLIRLVAFALFGSLVGLTGTFWMEYFGSSMLHPKRPVLRWLTTPQEIPEPYAKREEEKEEKKEEADK